MADRTTRYRPSTPTPDWLTAPVAQPIETKAIHLRLDPETVKFLAMARLESGATAETIIEALLQKLQTASAQEQTELYTQARTLAQSRKAEGLKKRRRTYRDQEDGLS